ncbi:hypothetical protein TGDOM2_300030 [Toxoplasma gondii GAB2-2007-GAL-DOM2]|uniref:Uncharacterized protein n=2 Tax=Toxoplasma gondii TaxID=5811 RepID=V4YIZ5_TOXGV|nr:hypothetical protein TGVEG_300030 [Toxoplasma gondii VEG]KFG47910.1 hypothetical protein TGDOM2_300030 [Toxoplasma gondii GAB2-2007-GAL-DOM2]
MEEKWRKSLVDSELKGALERSFPAASKASNPEHRLLSSLSSLSSLSALASPGPSLCFASLSSARRRFASLRFSELPTPRFPSVSSLHVALPPQYAFALRWYTPPSKRTWSKQHNKIFTPRPLSERFSPHKLHPEFEWWRERTVQPSALFMGFPDLLALPLRGGSAYIHEMDAATLAVVLASLAHSPSAYSVSERRPPPSPSPAVSLSSSSFSPTHLPQHLDSLLALLGRQAAATAAHAPDSTLAFLFRGCAEAGVVEKNVVCTLLGRVEQRLPCMQLPECLVLLDALRPGLPEVYRHPRFVARLVAHAGLLLQFRGAESEAEDLCDLAFSLVFAANCRDAALLQTTALLLVHGKRMQSLNETAPLALARAMEAFAACRDAVNAPLLAETAAAAENGDAEGSRNTKAAELFCASPLLRAREPSVHLSPSGWLLLSLLSPVVQALHRAEKGRRKRRGFHQDGEAAGLTAEREVQNRGASRESHALTEAAARAAAAVAEETQTLKNRESSLFRGLLRCLERVDDHRESLSPGSMCKVLFAATVARAAPSRDFFPDVLKRLGDQLGACTPEDLSRALFALVKLSSVSGLDPRCQDLLPPLLGTVLQAVESSLPVADVASLARLHSAAASALISSSETKKEEMKQLAEETSRLMHARLEEASPAHLTAFVRHWDLVPAPSGAFREALVAQAIRQLYFFDEDHLSRLLEGVTRLAASSKDETLLASVDELFRRAEEEATTEQAFFSPESCLRIFVSLVRYGEVRPEAPRNRERLVVALCNYLTGVDSVAAVSSDGASDPEELWVKEDEDLPLLFFAEDAKGFSLREDSALDRDSANESRLQALSAASYIRLLGALRELGVRGGVLLSRVAQLLHMKRYDLTDAQQEAAAEICASLGLEFQLEKPSGSSA